MKRIFLLILLLTSLTSAKAEYFTASDVMNSDAERTVGEYVDTMSPEMISVRHDGENGSLVILSSDEGSVTLETPALELQDGMISELPADARDAAAHRVATTWLSADFPFRAPREIDVGGSLDQILLAYDCSTGNNVLYTVEMSDISRAFHPHLFLGGKIISDQRQRTTLLKFSACAEEPLMDDCTVQLLTYQIDHEIITKIQHTYLIDPAL